MLISKRAVLVVLLLYFGFLIIKAMPYKKPDKGIALLLTQNASEIYSVDQERDTLYQELHYIDTVEFEYNRILNHKKHGPYSFYNEFFTDIEGTMNVKFPGNYEFKIVSDDGFSFSINKKNVISYENEKLYSSSIKAIDLSEGEKKFAISHFNGIGSTCLKAYYKKSGDNISYIMGEDSEYITFK